MNKENKIPQLKISTSSEKKESSPSIDKLSSIKRVDHSDRSVCKDFSTLFRNENIKINNN